MEGRVRRLQLNIRSPGAPEREVRLLAERFSRNVLEQFCQIVEDRFPGRDVVIRRMDLRCSLSQTQLADPAEASRYAAELVAAIVVPEIDDEVSAADIGAKGEAEDTGWHGTPRYISRRPGLIEGWSESQNRLLDEDQLVAATAGSETDAKSGRIAKEEDRDVAEPTDPLRAPAFNDAVEWIMSCLHAEARGAGNEWVYVWSRDAAAGSVEALALRRQAVIAALSRLDAARALIETLASLSPVTIDALLADLDVGAPFREMVRRWKSDSSQGPADDAAEPIAVAFEEIADIGGRLAALARRLPTTLPPDAAAVALYVWALALPAADGPPASERSADQPGVPGPPARHGSPPPGDQPVSEPPSLVPGTELRTRFGGLFYLLSLVLELGIGEALWKVCLAEGQVLARAAASILGDDAAGDVARLLFGGVTAAEASGLFTISPEQQEEVCSEILAAMVATQPRLGIGGLPTPLLHVVECSAGRLLVATCGFPVAIFAWPAPDVTAVAAGIEVFLRVWPATADAPRARDILLGLNVSDRLRPAVGQASMAPCLLPEAPTEAAGSVLAQVCGSVLQLFYTRLAAHEGEVASSPAALASRYLALPARIVLAPEAMTIVMPMDRINMALRRAALDRDPGWTPWLQRTVRIEFEPQGPGEVL
jgi:hypothetical protein